MKLFAITVAAALLVSNVASVAGQAKPVAPTPAPQGQASSVADGTPGVVPGITITPPADYVIGVGDVLAIVYWRDKDMTGDYAVRPDGKITMPLINDVDVQGQTTEQLRARLTKLSAQFLEEPITISVLLRAINSRKVYITGGIAKSGSFDLLVPMDVFSLIATAGGLKEWISGKNILIVRTEGGKTTTSTFNYQDFQKGKDLQKNILLKPGDRIVVPE
jgi:polysaccharide export outer membrane protein